MDEKTIYLVTLFGAGEAEDIERLVKAPTRAKVQGHILGINKASADDVARVLGAKGEIEEIA